MDNYTLSFDLDTHPVHTLMSLSGLRSELTKTRFFKEDGSYVSYKRGIDSLNAEKEWIQHLYELYLNNRNTLFFLAKVIGNSRETGKLLDQTLLDNHTFLDLKEQLYTRFKVKELGLRTFLFLEQINSDGNVLIHILFSKDMSSHTDDIYGTLYELSESGGFFLHEHGIYAHEDLNSAIVSTNNSIHDGLLIHKTEFPWFQKKFEYIGNLQGIAALITMIGAVLFLNEILYLPFGFLLLGFIVGIGVFAFVKSRKNTHST